MRWVSFLLGYAVLLRGLALAILFPHPTRFQVVAFAICFGVAAGGIGNGLAGTRDLRLGWLSASGSLAVAIAATYIVIRVALPDFAIGDPPTRQP
jgi:hypothetical protein